MGNTEGKPVDASDISDLDAAKAEIVEIRKALRGRMTKKVAGDNYPVNFRKKPSVMWNCLTQELYEKNMNLIGPRGYTFDMAIQCGLDGKGGTGVGIPDEESYYLWQEFYDKMIDSRHGHAPGAKHICDLDYTKVDSSKLPADLNDYCVSTRIRAARNISGFGLPPGITRAERREVARIISESLSGLKGELGGKYYSLESLTKEDSDQLRKDHFLFQIPNTNAMIFASGGCRDWPEGRGIFHNKDKTFLVWVNEEDQMRVISMQKGGNVAEVFERWAKGVNAVEEVVKAAGYKYMQDDHLGNFSSCISNVGTGLRASMHIKLPSILAQVGQHGLEEYCETLRMQCRGTGGEHTAAGSDGKVDISNLDRIGRSEVDLVQIMVDGVVSLIGLEKRAKAGEDVKAEIAAATGGGGGAKADDGGFADILAVAQSVNSPADASDVSDLAAAKAEIARYRAAVAKYAPKSDNFPKNFRPSPSIMFNTLTQADYDKAIKLVGPRGYTFDEAIQCGLDGRSGTGMAVPDEESYYLWQEWYDKMIDVRHNHPPGAKHNTDLDYTKVDTSKLPADLDDFCVSTRIRAARNISGFGLPPGSTREERRAVEALIKKALSGVTGELAGTYYSLTDMSKEDEAQLQADHFLFQIPNPDAMIFSSGGCRDWPDARGIYHNKDKTFLVWVNEEDQMRVISMQKGGNVAEVFERWCKGVNEVEKTVKATGRTWMQNDHLGNFSSCVSNVGTGLRASMFIKLPCILKAVGQDALGDFCKAMRMDCRGAGGEHTAAGAGGTVDISNCDRIGKSEVELVQIMVNGIVKLIELEKKAAGGEDIKPLMKC